MMALFKEKSNGQEFPNKESSYTLKNITFNIHHEMKVYSLSLATVDIFVILMIK